MNLYQNYDHWISLLSKVRMSVCTGLSRLEGPHVAGCFLPSDIGRVFDVTFSSV